MKRNETNEKNRPTFIFFVPPSLNKTNEIQLTKRIEREKNRTIDEVETRIKKNRAKEEEEEEKKRQRIVIYPTRRTGTSVFAVPSFLLHKHEKDTLANLYNTTMAHFYVSCIYKEQLCGYMYKMMNSCR